MYKVVLNEKLREYYVYCEAYVVDYYGLVISMGSEYDYKSYSHEFPLKGQKIRIYILPSPEYKFHIKMTKESTKWTSFRPSIGKTVLEI